MRKCYSFFSILVLSGCGMVGNTVISDAVCSGTTGNKKRSCNALEKAANRC
ncbi:hypothetical protein [Gallibacterium genomosp. 1]|uniref:hypothetical protein n=1 Tax=Gallibacterium genomosp. 1 TaxID=155515 RepID=UPI0012E8917B|nr:hypothetical protein [Gallibacterium genomosp. 1]